MKILLLFLTITASLSAVAQKNFQGTIVYRILSNEMADNSETELTVVFGVNKIRVSYKDHIGTAKEKTDSEEILINLDSGKVFIINTDQKIFHARRIPPTPALVTAPKIIAGHSTTPVITSTSGSSLVNFLKNSRIVLYKSNDLFFSVPERFSFAPELLMISEGRIVLGATISYSDRIFEKQFDDDEVDSTTNFNKLTTIEAIEIKPGIIPTSAISIPDHFTKIRINDSFASDSTMITDSVAAGTEYSDEALSVADSMAIADTTFFAPKVPEPKAGIPSKPAKPKSNKSSQNSPARKPD